MPQSRRIVALVAVGAALATGATAAAGPGSSAGRRACAFAHAKPCPATPARVAQLQGDVLDADRDASAVVVGDVEFEGVRGRLAKALRGVDQVQAIVGPRTRVFALAGDGSVTRIDGPALFAALDAADAASVQVTGRLAPGSRWSDEEPMVAAGALVVTVQEAADGPGDDAPTGDDGSDGADQPPVDAPGL
jgi:hypothetical protein